MILLSVLAAIVPMLLYPLFLYWMDRYEKEPLALLGATFLWGFVPAAILSLITQTILGFPFLLLDETGTLADTVGTVFLAPVTEEIFKGIAVLVVFLLWRNEFDGVFDGIIYGGLVGFGFAAMENVLYFTLYYPGDAATIVLRAVVFGLNHALFTSLTGIGFGIARHARKPAMRFLAPLAGLLAATLVHFLHNASATFAQEYVALFCLAIVTDWGGVLLVLVIMILAVRRERRWIVEQLQEEVGRKTLSQDDYEIAASPLRRFGTRLTALTTGGLSRWRQVRRYFRLLTELAYKKHAHSRRGEAGASQKLIDDLRSQAADMGAALGGDTAQSRGDA